MITATNEATGELIELKADTLPEIVEAWRIASEYDKAATSLKDQLKKLVPEFINDKGVSEEYKGYAFRSSGVQRWTYDKAILRQVFDEDQLDLFLKPVKKDVDDYLKQHLEELGEDSTKLRNAMIPDGKPYSVIKLEKLKRD